VAHVREHSTFTCLLEPMIDQAGLETVDTDSAKVGAYAGHVCAKRRR
jgi:hypothetical protein